MLVVAAASVGASQVRTTEHASSEQATVIVRPAGSSAAARAAVERLGGTVVRPLGILNGFTAVLPADRTDDLARDGGVASVTRDASLKLLAERWKPDKDLGSYSMTTTSVGAQELWRESDLRGAKITGKGIGVALIDSGISPVEGLQTPGKIVNGPDLSFESQVPTLRNLDTFGHGTHMAGVIAGRDATVKAGNESSSSDFLGVAPDATLVNLKVATSDGAVDVSQVIASIDWAVQHRDDPGMNIRVLNLSFGTDSAQSYELDPLAFAVEVAWRRGIVVVVAAGNDGAAGTSLTMPAIDPYVISVGASDHNGTLTGADDTVATFSSVGNSTRRPDLLAPGRSIVSLRDPGSSIDLDYPTAIVADKTGPRFFRGSGTSQAAAVVSGAAALLLQQRPSLTPDQVKYVLTRNARKLAGTVPAQGAGVLDLVDIDTVVPPWDYRQTFPPATGTGSLERSRGGSHVADPATGIELTGEQDIMGTRWNGRSWSAASWAGTSWQGGSWLGEAWTGDGRWFNRSGTWPAVSWQDSTWAGPSWSGLSLSYNSWNGRSWSGRSWSGRSWSAGAWS